MIGTTLQKLLNEKGTNVNELSRKTGVSAQTLYSIIKRDNMKIDFEVLLKLCDALSVPVETFYSGSAKARLDAEKPTAAEWRLIQKYRAVDAHGQDLLDTILEKEYLRCTAPKHLSLIQEEPLPYNVIPFRISEQKASAGRGVYLGPEAFTMTNVVENELTKRAAFGVPVSGDSMEPLFYDGEILMVEKAETLTPGEIGVFTLQGEAFVKQFGGMQLISLNPKYAPILIDESIILNGRVIGILQPEWIVD